MASLYPEIEPYAHGMLDVGDGQRVYWETCGNPNGKPALVLHGGPGSGCTPWQRRLFDPERVPRRAVRSAQLRPQHAARERARHRLSANTTGNLIADIERAARAPRDRALAGAGRLVGQHAGPRVRRGAPGRVTELVLFGVTTGRRQEDDWLFREGLRPLFPEQWPRRRDALPGRDRTGDIVEAYRRLLETLTRRCASGRPRVVPVGVGDARLATTQGCRPATTTRVPRWRSRAWSRTTSPTTRSSRTASCCATRRDRGHPGVLINGRFDLQAPLGTAWELARRLPLSELVVVGRRGPLGRRRRRQAKIVRATDGFSEHR